MADEWGEGRAGLLLWDTPPLIRVEPAKEGKSPGEGRAKKARETRTHRPAADKPVARVLVDMPQDHLDRPFDYLVPEKLAEQARPGVRVRVRFAGALIDGFLIERADDSDHQGTLRYIERVLSAEQVLTEEIAGLARAVADRYAGTLADVLRLAIPPRHARVEAEAGPQPSAGPKGQECPPASLRPPPARPAPGPWARYPAGAAFLAALADGRAPRAVWTALPGRDWPEEIARAAGTAAAAGRGALIVVPDARDLSLVDQALARVLGPGQHACLSADLGPAERYRRWLAVSRGAVRVAAGTRGAMFAPVHDLGLVALWDDGDDLHDEPRAPYPHAREVLALRAHRARAAALVGGFARTAEATSLIATGWAAALAADRPVVRRFAPHVRAAGADAELARDEAARSARMPSLALRTARDALARGPVLVQVPRRGYLTGLACAGCRAPARCAVCGGPLAVESSGAPARCRWCGRHDAGWRCPACGHGRVRAVVTGASRTAEELGRAFPGARVVVSGGTATVTSVPAAPALVVATPGAEPLAEGGYAAAVLLDGWVLLSRPSLAAAQEALRRWLNAAALVAPGPSGGTVILVADAALPTAQALIRWDPVTHAERELAEREALRFPPAARIAAVTGPAEVVGAFLAEVALPAEAELIGPAALGGADRDKVQGLIRIPRSGGLALAAALRATMAARTARKETGQIRIQLDPAELI